MNFLPNIEVRIAKKLAASARNFTKNAQKICLISDKKIWDNVQNFFSDDFKNNVSQIIILKDPKPDEKNLSLIEQKIKNADLLVAVGSGVISDLVKFSSFKTKIPYLIFATAPSMNGYLSQNASILINGHKKTLAATLPLAVYADLDILKSAPTKMIQAGIGDAMCFYGCWFDWLLSHLIIKTDFNKKPFLILQKKIRFLITNYKKFNLEDEELLKILMKILLLSGAGMTIAKGSYPASQSEHLIAHAYEMKYKNQAKNNLHGLQIAITSLTTAKIQENLLKKDAIQIKDHKFLKQKMARFFNKKIATQCEIEFLKKASKSYFIDWKKQKNILQKVLLPQNDLRKIFQHFKIETSPLALGISKESYEDLIVKARFIRDRFTCLDLE